LRTKEDEKLTKGTVQRLIEGFERKHGRLPPPVSSNSAAFLMENDEENQVYSQQSNGEVDFHYEHIYTSSSDQVFDQQEETMPSPLKPPMTIPREPSQFLSVPEEYDHDDDNNDFITKPISFALPLLLSREYVNIQRQSDIFWSSFKNIMITTLIFTLIYAPIHNDQNSIQNRIGLLYQITVLTFGVGRNASIDSLSKGNRIFQLEYLNGLYSSYAFILSYLIHIIPFIIIPTFCFAIFMTHVIGLVNTIEGYFGFVYVIFCIFLAGECIGMIFCTIFQHTGLAWNLMMIYSTFLSKFFCFFFFLNLFSFIFLSIS
jgi:hypothetical protein